MVTRHDGYLNHLELMGYCSIPPQVSGMNTDRHFKWWNTPDRQTNRHAKIELDQLKSVPYETYGILSGSPPLGAP